MFTVILVPSRGLKAGWGGAGGELASLGTAACWRVLEMGREAAAAMGLETGLEAAPALGVGLVGATGTGGRGAV